MTARKLVIIGAGVALTGTAMAVVHSVSAASCPSYVPSVFCNATANGFDIGSLVRNIIEFIFALAGLVALIFVILAGFKFITIGGDSGKKEEAQKQIVAAVIGLLIIIFSYFIIQLVFSFLGLGNPTKLDLPCTVSSASGNQSTVTVSPCISAAPGS